MTTAAQFVLHLISGFILGAATLFMAVVATVGFAFATNDDAQIPGIFRAWFSTANALPALNFEPSARGMLLAIGVVAAIYALFASRIGKRIAGRGRSAKA